ncbi:MAG: 50S ribosomal protein L11 methyltransferase [Verrucomicrobiota bacterium JB023]|nr:50S ribosomal protein L11 methyltransferase [Verrucomicrobiota bacterium JB023]
MAKLAAIGGGDSVLDPACGSGLLLSLVGMNLGASLLHGIDINAETVETARILASENTKIFCGDSVHGDHPLEESYDCIVAESPMGLRLNPPLGFPGGVGKVTDVGEALLCQSVSRLSESGRAVFLLPPPYACQKGRKLWNRLEDLGGHLRALIHVPAGHHKAASIDYYIVVVDKVARQQVFTAQFGTDTALEEEILKNYENHQGGKRLAQGALVTPEEFSGFPSLEANDELQKLARRSGLNAIPISSLVTKHESRKGLDGATEDSANDLFLTLDGKRRAALTPGDLGALSKNRRLLRLVLDAEQVDARFMVDSLNSEVGRLFIDSISSGSTIQRISVQDLLDSTYFLPPRDIQDQVIDANSRLTALRAELDEIESALRRQPRSADKQLALLEKVNHEDTLEAWVETLPFPLASILWRWRASNGGIRERNEILLHFFEALSEFWATIYLSAAKSDSEFWSEHGKSLHANLEKANLSFDRATFGLWKCVIETLSKKFRDLREKDSNRCAAMFGTGRKDVLDMLFDRRILTVLQDANGMRNDHAHGGVLGARDLEIIYERLSGLIQTCRSVMGTTWERYELTQPAECRYTNGLFEYSVKRLVGTRTPFVTAERTTIEGMDDGYLHFMDPDGDRFIKLLPFLRVMASPQTATNACYFYNRNLEHQHRFVSYHFEADSEVEDLFADTAAALDSLRPLPEL